MIKTENEMPSTGSEMPPGNMTDSPENLNDQMPKSENEMPPGNMVHNAENFSNEMPLGGGGGEMPRGNMTESNDNFSDQLSPSNMGGNEMPPGKMTDSNQVSGSVQALSDVNEMPLGNMNGDAAAGNAEQDKAKTIEIPGTWKLQMTYISA